jgi:hypothetical protein
MTNNNIYLTINATNFINYTTCFGPNGPSAGVSIYTLSTNELQCELYTSSITYICHIWSHVLTSTLLGDINLCETIVSDIKVKIAL